MHGVLGLVSPVNDVQRIKDVLTVIHHVKVLGAILAWLGLKHQRAELRQLLSADAFH